MTLKVLISQEISTGWNFDFCALWGVACNILENLRKEISSVFILQVAVPMRVSTARGG